MDNLRRDFKVNQCETLICLSVLKVCCGENMDIDQRHFDIIENIEKHVEQLIISKKTRDFDIIGNIKKHIEQLTPWEPSQAIVCIGKYPTQIILKGSFVDKINDILPIFIDKSGGDIKNWSQLRLKSYNILGLDKKIDTFLWFNVYSDISKDDMFINNLKNKPLDNVKQAIVLASIGDGIGSSLFPLLCSQLKTLRINPLGLAVLPSEVQSPDMHFNAFSSMGLTLSTSFTPLLLIDRGNLENYVGVNREGSKITGNVLLNYLLELLLENKKIVQEISEFSRSFNTNIFTTLLTMGASFRVFGSIENMCSTALLNPLLKFDLSSVSLLYVLLRIPSHLKTKLPREKIELSIANWVRDKVNLKSIYVSDPLYVDEVNDRIDVVLLFGGFDVTELFASMEKEISPIKNEAINRGLIKEEEWEGIVKSLLKD
jgi:hypothetical protein